jgi:hypothetical protein
MMRKKSIWIPLVVLLIVFGLGIVLEPFVLKKINQTAENVNPEFKGHVEDLSISFLKGALVLEGVTASLKKNDRKFFEADEVFADIAWRELIRGRISLDLAIERFHVLLKDDVLKAVKRLPPSEKKEMKVAFKVAELRVVDSTISLLDYPGLREDKHFTVKDINGVARDITQRKDTELASFDFKATVDKKDDVRLTGNFDLAADPVRWDLNSRLIKFQLASMNPELRKRIPLNYKKGTLDMYSEVKSENGEVYGYVKPFLNDIEYMGNKIEFEGPKHFFVEVLGSFSNWILENKDKKTVATRVPFIYKDGKFSVESGEAVSKAVEHGLTEENPVDRGIEKKYRLNKENPKEVQAQEEKLKEKKE